MRGPSSALALAALYFAEPSAALQARAGAGANPIRRVVTMLQNIQKKVSEEGEKADDLYAKYMCYCKNNKGGLQKEIDTAEDKVAELGPGIQAKQAKKAELGQEVEKHKADRTSAVEALAKAKASRVKENAEFEKENADSQANVASITRAVDALEKGMGSAFLQTRHADTLQRLVKRSPAVEESDRQTVLAFLSGEYAPQSGEITGILKTLGDEMSADLSSAVADEKKNANSYGELRAAKKKESSVLDGSIERKLNRLSTLGVEIAEMQNEIGDTADALEEDKLFLANLEKNCATKDEEHKVDQNMRSEEQVALAETVKILNHDDALDLFKKTLPSPSFLSNGPTSFLQVEGSGAAVRAQALSALRHGPGVDFISLALRGKKVGFDKVVAMIGKLVVTLNEEQDDDNKKKTYCGAELDKSEDQHKHLGNQGGDLDAAIAEAKDTLEEVTGDIKALKASIVSLDKSVAEATEQRQAENKEHKELMANNGAAVDLITFAKNRLAKFYNPNLYKAPKKRELTEEERIFVSNGGELPPDAAPGGIAGTGISGAEFVQVASSRSLDAPPPAPETAARHTKKTKETNGVTAMMDLLVRDLEKEMTTAKAEEKNDQESYEKASADAAEKRALTGKTLGDRETAHASLSENLQAQKSSLKATHKERANVAAVIANLHGECDFLLKYHGTRKEARDNEIDGLGKAKAVLAGADYSLLQTGSRRGRVSRHA